jgi:hypothetical protein
VRESNIALISIRDTNEKVNTWPGFLKMPKAFAGERNTTKVILKGITTMSIFNYL